MRSLTLNSLPNTLISSETYSPPPLLINGYRAQLQALNLLDVARTARPSGRPIVGGVTLDDTHDHFIWRYLNSATRIERIVLDIRATFDLVPDKLLQTLAGGKIAILDVACGCGATVLALTTLIAELRGVRAIPTLPLTLTILGADISPSALQIYEALLGPLKLPLAIHGVTVNWETRCCDILEITEVVTLCDHWISAQSSADEFLIVVGNVSSLSKSKFTQMQPGIKHMIERISNRPGSLIWIEPLLRSGPVIIKKFLRTIEHMKSLIRLSTMLEGPSCEYNWLCPITDNTVPSGVRLIDYVRTPRE